MEEEETRSSGIVMGMASLEDISAQRAKLQPAVSHINSTVAVFIDRTALFIRIIHPAKLRNEKHLKELKVIYAKNSPKSQSD